jgi:hypothetical protein
MTGDVRERLVWYCAGLESILLKDRSEPILVNLAERLAMFAYETVNERMAAISDVRAAYSLRSEFVHHGVDVADEEIIGRFARHGVKLFLRIAKGATSFVSKTELLDHIDRMKLAGTHRQIHC